MSSVLRPVRKRKKVRTLGPVDVIDRKEYAELDVDTKVELIRSLVPLGLLHVEELLDDEVTALAGGRYARKDASVGGRGVGARMRAGLRASNRRARHLPMRYETGLPSSVIRFRTLHASTASRRCPDELRARRLGEFNWSSQHLDDEVLRCRDGNGDGQTGRVGLRCVHLVGRR